MSAPRRVCILGYGKLGRSLVEAIHHDPDVSSTHCLAGVWNRDPTALADLPEALRLTSLDDIEATRPDLVVEVAHPVVSQTAAPDVLRYADFMVGSPTAFADQAADDAIRAAAAQGHGVYVPRGALPGLDEVLAMYRRGKLAAAHITMRKHPQSLRLTVDTPQDSDAPYTVHDGPLRPLCAIAPNNVNTMAVLALASGLGFDAVRATLQTDPSLRHHITEVELLGPDTGGPRYRLALQRHSPAAVNAVTSTATLSTFLASMRAATGQGSGLHFC